MLKKLLLCLSAAAVSTFSVAKSGGAFIPHFQTATGGSNINTQVFVSNVSNKDSEITVTLYNEDGSTIHDNNAANSGNLTIWPYTTTSYSEPSSGSTATFTLEPNKTITLTFVGSYKLGYGEIEWTQDSNRRKTTLAHARVQRNVQQQGYTIHINNGKPF